MRRKIRKWEEKMESGPGAGNEEAKGKGVGRAQAISRMLEARKRTQDGSSASSISAVSAGRGQLLRSLNRGGDSLADLSSSSGISQPGGGGRGSFLRSLAAPDNSSDSGTSGRSSSSSARQEMLARLGRQVETHVGKPAAGRACLVSTELFLLSELNRVPSPGIHLIGFVLTKLLPEAFMSDMLSINGKYFLLLI